MAMYDYRKDLARILTLSKNSNEDLEKLSLMLRIISNLSLNTNSKISEQNLDKILSSLINNTAKEENVLEEHSEENSENQHQENVQIIKKSDSDLQSDALDPHTYRVQRLLSGAKILNNQGRQRAYYNEKFIHNRNWHTGDLVKVNAYEDDRGDERPWVDELIPQNTDDDAYNIGVFEHGIVETDSAGQLYVEKSLENDHLRDFNPQVEAYSISSDIVQTMHLHDGDIVDLAWRIDQPFMVKIRWIHTGNDRDNLLIGQSPDYTTPISKSSKHSDHDTDASSVSESVSVDLDFDLKQQTVGIVVGDEIREHQYQELLDQHHGKLLMINAFQKHVNNSSYFDNAVSKCDIIILVQNYNKHNASGNVLTAVKNYDKKFAIANSAGIQSIERAIYRADQGLAAYEPATSSINYPLINESAN